MIHFVPQSLLQKILSVIPGFVYVNGKLLTKFVKTKFNHDSLCPYIKPNLSKRSSTMINFVTHPLLQKLFSVIPRFVYVYGTLLTKFIKTKLHYDSLCHSPAPSKAIECNTEICICKWNITDQIYQNEV